MSLKLDDFDFSLNSIHNDLSRVFTLSLNKFAFQLSMQHHIKTIDLLRMRHFFNKALMTDTYRIPMMDIYEICNCLDIKFINIKQLSQRIKKSIKTHVVISSNRDICVKNIIKDIASLVIDSYQESKFCTQIVFAWYMLKLLPFCVYLNEHACSSNPVKWCLESIQQSTIKSNSETNLSLNPIQQPQKS